MKYLCAARSKLVRGVVKIVGIGGGNKQGVLPVIEVFLANKVRLGGAVGQAVVAGKRRVLFVCHTSHAYRAADGNARNFAVPCP